MKRIGLTQRVELGRERRDCLDQAWADLLIRNGYWPIPLPNRPDPPMGVPSLLRDLGLSGVILTGGNNLQELGNVGGVAPERDTLEAQLLDSCSEADVPVFGVCRGLQKMVVHYGGRLERIGDHVASRHALRVTEGCQLPLTDRAEVNSFHDYGVRSEDVCLPLEVVAWSPDGLVEAVAHRDYRQWAVMWHPERDPRDPRDLLLIRGLFD